MLDEIRRLEILGDALAVGVRMDEKGSSTQISIKSKEDFETSRTRREMRSLAASSSSGVMEPPKPRPLVRAATNARLVTKHDDIQEQIAHMRAKLPGYIRKLIAGYEMRVYWFEVVECARKLVLVGIPCFFEPGTTPQLVFGMLCSVISLQIYSDLKPFEKVWDDRLSQVCQLQIFVSLLAELYLSYAPDSVFVSWVLLMFLLGTGLLAVFTEDFVREELEKQWSYWSRWRISRHSPSEDGQVAQIVHPPVAADVIST